MDTNVNCYTSDVMTFINFTADWQYLKNCLGHIGKKNMQKKRITFEKNVESAIVSKF